MEVAIVFCWWFGCVAKVTSLSYISIFYIMSQLFRLSGGTMNFVLYSMKSNVMCMSFCEGHLARPTFHRLINE